MPASGSSRPPGPRLGGARARGPQTKASRALLRRRRLAALAGVLVVAVLLLAAVAGYAVHLNSQVRRMQVRDLTPAPTAGKEKGSENILLVGSTSRCALKVQNPAYGLCSQGVTGVNSDVVMVLHLRAADHALSILSIPRDMFIPNARAEGANKIDAALAQGPSQLVDAIEQDFAIPIQHYVELNFDTFAAVVDALGGVKMYFPEPVFDAYSGLDVRTPGCRQLNGPAALQVVRARHLQYKSPAVSALDPRLWPQEPESDLARIRRDHEFLRVLAGAVTSQGLGNPLADQRIVSAVAPQLQVDSGLSSAHLLDLALSFRHAKLNQAPQLTLPIVPTTIGGYRYRGGSYGSIVWPAQPQDRQVIDQFLGVDDQVDTMTGRPLPAAGSVTVSVLNGTGKPHEAADGARALQRLGYDVVRTGDTPPVGPQSETVVYYASPANAAAAQAVLQAQAGHAVLGVNPQMVSAGTQVTVVTGSDFAVQTPPAPTKAAAGATHQPAAAGQSTQAAAGSPEQAPTAPVEALAPWDPRSCTSQGQ